MNRLAIIGAGNNWQEAAGDCFKDRWLVSSAYFDKPYPVEKVFQLHKPGIWEPGIEAIKPRLVIAWSKPGFEECERLPFEAILAEFGPIFPSSISWMLGYALTLGYDDITIAGVDMASDTEYAKQRDALFLLIGIATGQGVKITIPKTSGIYIQPEAYGIPREE